MPSKQLIAILALIWEPRPTPMAGAFSIGSSQRTTPPKDVSSTTNTNNRRQLLSSIFGLAPSILMIESVHASCITGDESVDCIGVYKEGIPESSNDGIVSQQTIKQSYGAFRPDRSIISLPNPTSFTEAVGMLKDQMIAIDDIEKMISDASFESAGVSILHVLPRIILAGRYIATNMQSVPQIKQFADDVSTLALSVDKNIGKAVRGNLGGSIPMSQMMLLSDVKALRTSLERFITRATLI